MVASPNAWLWVASGAVALLGAAALPIHLRLRHGSAWSDALLGAGTWTVSVGLKLVGALIVGGMLWSLFGNEIPLGVDMVATGLLTGVFECGITLVVVALTRLREGRPASALGFGMAFGAFEALVLGVPVLLGGLAAILWLDAMPPEDARELAKNTGDAVRPFTFLLERVIAVPLHALTCIWIILSVRQRRAAPFLLAFVVKSACDAVPTGDQIPLALQQLIYVAIGIVAALLLGPALRSLSRAAPDAGASSS